MRYLQALFVLVLLCTVSILVSGGGFEEPICAPGEAPWHLVQEDMQGDQDSGDVTRLPDGGFVICYEDQSSNSNYTNDILARVFNSDGSPRTGVIRVNNVYTRFSQDDPRCASTGNGYWAAAYASGGVDGSGQTIMARIFDSSGSAITEEFQVSKNFTRNYQDSVEVAGLHESDGFVFVWESYGVDRSENGVVIVVYNEMGVNTTEEILVNQNRTYEQEEPAVAVGAHDVIAVVWETDILGPPFVVFRTFSPEGVPLTNETWLSLENMTEIYQVDPSVVALHSSPDAEFFVSWLADWPGSIDDEVYGRRMRADGLPNSDTVRLHASNDLDQWNPETTVMDDGRVLLVYGDEQDDVDHLRGRIFDVPNGSSEIIPAGREFVVVTTETQRWVADGRVASLQYPYYVVSFAVENPFDSSDSAYFTINCVSDEE